MADRSYEIQGEPRQTEATAAFLLRIGGRNPFGEPNYRLIHTSTRYHLQGGAWKVWDEALSIEQRGGMVLSPESGLMVPSTCQPNRVEICVKPIHKYDPELHGWALERWVPASFYGSQGEWERQTLKDRADIPLLGPYPAQGGYELCSSIEKEYPGETRLQEAINYQTYTQEMQVRGDIGALVAQRVYEAEQAYEEQCARQAEETEYRIKEYLSPWKSLSLESSRWRNRSAEKLGIREHA